MITIIIMLAGCETSPSVVKTPGNNQSALLPGFVFDKNGPVKNAVVRIQCTTTICSTDSAGRFSFINLDPEQPVVVTVWAPGYYITGGSAYTPDKDTVRLELTPIPEGDNQDYKWLSSFTKAGDPSNCENCHASENNSGNLPFDEWKLDAHSQSADNIRFLTMYLGTDINGNKSPDTRFGYNRDYGKYPLPPVFDETYFGPGYKLDFTNTQGNCAACHTPLTAVNNPYGINPTQVENVAAEGINCDFCHKIWDVKLNPATGTPYNNMPGVLSFEFRRPGEGHQFFAGPFDDVAPGEDTYTPIQNESAYCAPCHFGKFWDVEIYNSFGEWLESPYSDPETGQTCQDCHMPAGISDRFATEASGGNRRDASTIFSHLMPGARDETLLRNSVTLVAEAEKKVNEISVRVKITNDKTGHHVPTDSPLRHMILVVIAINPKGDTLSQKSGPLLPDWCGKGNRAEGNYSGLPGKAYAKILKNTWTGISPTAAYWNRTKLESDNRLAAFETDITEYIFDPAGAAKTIISVRLYYRRAFKDLMKWKSWTDPDILMAEQTILLK